MKVWGEAGVQIFYSYGLGIAALVALGSFNTFDHKSYRDVIAFTMTSNFTSILAGFVVFAFLGHMAHTKGVDIDKVVDQGS